METLHPTRITEMSKLANNPLEKTNILPQHWYARPSPEVAPDLLGKVLVRQFANGDRLRGQIVETEAYAPGDPACHAYKRKTQRNQSMFGTAGHLYIYLIYGIHHCLNIVTDDEGVGSAVLVRAVQLDRLPSWIDNKKRHQPHRVAAGPGLLCQALQVNRQLDGFPLAVHEGEALWVESEPFEPATEEEGIFGHQNIVQTTRIGLKKGVEIPWRWYIQQHPAVSKY